METQLPDLPPVDHNWEPEIDNEDNASIDDLKFIFNQAEKRLDDTAKSFDAATSKFISFIGLTTTLLAALSAYFFINNDPHGVPDAKLITAFLASLYTGYVLFKFVQIVLPKTYWPVGDYPQDLYKNEMFSNELKGYGADSGYSYITKCLYLSELKQYNIRIARNEETNQLRANQFNISAKMICIMPILALLIYLICLLFT